MEKAKDWLISIWAKVGVSQSIGPSLWEGANYDESGGNGYCLRSTH